jgi:hypothetical protein
MKKSLLLCGLLLALTASYASAAGLTLAWSACLTDGGTPNRSSTCLVNTGTNALVGTFQLGADQVGTTGIEVIVDIATAGASLPAWWGFQAGGCRTPSLAVNPTIAAAAANCVDWANGVAAGGLAAYQLGAGGPNTARIVIGFAVAAAAAGTETAGQDYFGFNVLINNAKTAGLGSCAGCSVPACIVFNSCNVVAGTLTHDKVSGGASPGSDFVTWQGGGGISSNRGSGCPLATPTRSTTWTSVKSLYR